MLSKAKEKYIRSLHQKKFRQIEGKFIVEGIKTINELLLAGYFPDEIILIEGIELDKPFRYIEYCNENEFKSISQLSNPEGALAVYKQSTFESEFSTNLNDRLVLVLNEMNDPGNLGTILRTAAWFGVKLVFLTENSVDVYNIKTLQAAKSSFAQLKIVYLPESDISTILKENNFAIAIAHMEGKNIFDYQFKEKTAIVLGNEARGVSKFWIQAADEKLTIVKQGYGESLNVSVSAAVILAALTRVS